jgi:hypothetical protein
LPTSLQISRGWPAAARRSRRVNIFCVVDSIRGAQARTLSA